MDIVLNSEKKKNKNVCRVTQSHEDACGMNEVIKKGKHTHLQKSVNRILDHHQCV